MAGITLNANGTSVPFFKIGKTGVTLYQGPADPSLSYTINVGDYWLNTTTNAIEVRGAVGWNAPRLADLEFINNSIVAQTGQDLILSVDDNKSVIIDSTGTGPSLITTTDARDLHINPATGGGQYLILNQNRWPTTDGTAGQALITNGSGVLSFQTISGSGSNYKGQVANQSAMLALVGIVVGDYVYRQDTGTNWQCNALPSSSIGNWVNLGFVESDILPITLDSVNGRIGINTATPLEQLDVGIGNILLRQVPVPTSAPTLAAVAGGSVDVGQHWYSVAYITPLGDTARSLSTNSITISSGNQTVNLTSIPISPDASVTGRKIYRSKAGESNRIQYLIATINDNVTTTYTDTAADSTLTVLAKNVSRAGSVIFQRQGSTTRPIIQIDETTTSIGDRTNTNGTGYNITNVGVQQLQLNTTGHALCAFGNLALNANTTGFSNSAYGVQALFSNTTGSSNTAVGVSALGSQQTPSSNVGVGINAGSGAITGSFNTFLGPNAGSGVAFSSTNNIFIGSSAGTGALQSTSVTNTIAIGKLAATPRSNMAVIGDDLVAETQLRGSVRISSADTVLPAPNANAALDLGGITTKGILLPLVSTTSRDAMTTPSSGILIYNSTTNALNIRTASAWESVLLGTWASQAEAEAGVDNTKGMTPLRVKQAINALSPSVSIGTGSDSITAASGSHATSNFTYTQNGVQWTYQYSAGIPVSRKAWAGTGYELSVGITESGGYYVENANDNVYVHGTAIRMTMAKALALGAAMRDGTIPAIPGLKAFVYDVGSVIDSAGVASSPIGTILTFGKVWWNGSYSINDNQVATYTGNATSGVLKTHTGIAGFLGKYGSIETRVNATHPGGGTGDPSGAITIRVELNASECAVLGSGTSAGAVYVEFKASVRNAGSASVQRAVNKFQQTDGIYGSGNNTTTIYTGTLNTDSVAPVLTFKASSSKAADATTSLNWVETVFITKG